MAVVKRHMNLLVPPEEIFDEELAREALGLKPVDSTEESPSSATKGKKAPNAYVGYHWH